MPIARHAVWGASCALLLAFATPSVRADEPNQLEQARTYFNIGARAYAAGQFADAVHAFEQAYKLTPRDGLLFSLAQAYRKQYYVSRQADDLRAAIKYYREYLDRVPKGGRRADVADALAELTPLAAKLELAQTPAAPVVEAKPLTQVMLSSATHGVRVDIDGRPRGKLPLVVDVAPGNHRVRLYAKGYQDYVRDVSVRSGQTVPIDRALPDEPARVEVRAPSGAHVSVDGTLVGSAPLPLIPLAPGKHSIAVTENGRTAFTRELRVQRDQSVRIDATLQTSTQRTVSWILLGAGASSFVASGILAIGAYRKQRDAKAILDRRMTQNITSSERDEYSSLRDGRDTYRTASIATAALGLGLAATGVALYLFDEPKAEVPTFKRERQPGVPEPTHEGPSMELSASAGCGPASAWAALVGRF